MSNVRIREHFLMELVVSICMFIIQYSMHAKFYISFSVIQFISKTENWFTVWTNIGTARIEAVVLISLIRLSVFLLSYLILNHIDLARRLFCGSRPRNSSLCERCFCCDWTSYCRLVPHRTIKWFLPYNKKRSTHVHYTRDQA